MFGQDPHAVYEMIERLHGSLCCYRELRAKYRPRGYRASSPATASASPLTVGPPAAPAPPPPQPPPAASASPPVSPPISPAPPAPQPSHATTATPRTPLTTTAPATPLPPVRGVPGLDDVRIVAYRAIQGGMVPVYADPGELIGFALGAGVSNAAANKEASATPGAPPTAQPAATIAPDPASQAAHAAPRTQPAAAALSLDPPKPPTIVREVDQTSPIERVLAEHRALLAEQAKAADEHHTTILRDLLAEHRQALATADERHRTMLVEILAQHRAELQEVSARVEGDRAALEALRELLAEQATTSAEQNACLGDMIAALVETVSRIALSRATPRAPTFAPPPLRVVAAATSDPDVPHPSTPSKDKATPPPEAAPTLEHSAATQPASSLPPPIPAVTEPAASSCPRSAPATRPAPQAPSASATTLTAALFPGAPASRVGYVTPRASSLLALVTEMTPEPAPDQPTPRQLRAEQEARARQRMHEAVDECADDEEFMAGTDDSPESMEAPRA